MVLFTYLYKLKYIVISYKLIYAHVYLAGRSSSMHEVINKSAGENYFGHHNNSMHHPQQMHHQHGAFYYARQQQRDER